MGGLYDQVFKLIGGNANQSLDVLTKNSIHGIPIFIYDASGNQITSFGGGGSVTQGTSPWVISGAVSQNGPWLMRLQDGSGNAVSSTSGTLDTNIARMNGIAVTMGNGASGTGVQRVTIANDSTGRVNASSETSTIYNGTTAVTPVFGVIDVASSGDNTIVNADATKKIRVFSLVLVASAAVTVRFESAAGGTALTGQMQLAANAGFVLPFNPLGWFETAANQLLNLELSGAISVDGNLTYGLI